MDERLQEAEWPGTPLPPHFDDEPPAGTERGVIAYDSVATARLRREKLTRQALDALDRLLGDG